MKQVTIHNKSKAVQIGSQITLADTSLSRMVGLLGKRQLDAGCGVLIRPSSGVHTFGMRFPIDVIALDRNLRVLKLWQRLAPYKITPMSLGTHSVLELSSGQIRACGIEVGDQLEMS
jgi:uncharacterized protein